MSTGSEPRSETSAAPAAALPGSALAVALPVVLGACLAILAGCYQIRTFDTLFHLAAGRYIVAHGAVPKVDPFSYSFPGASWLNHSWGFQYLLAKLYGWGGFAALSIHQAVVSLALAVCAGLSVRAQRALWPAAALLFALAMCSFREVLEARPHVLGYLCLSLVLLLALALRRQPTWQASVGLLCVYALWATLHGSHLLAFVVLAVGLLLHARRSVPQAITWACVTLAALGLGLWLAPAAFDQGSQHLRSEFLESSISEWYPVSLSELLGAAAGRVFLLCWLLALSGVLAAHAHGAARFERLQHAAYSLSLLLCFALLSLSSRRMLPLFLFGAAPLWLPYAAHAAAHALAALDTALAAKHKVSVLVQGCGWLLCALSLYASSSMFHAGIGLDEPRFPVHAVDAIAKAGRIKRIYNAYNFGGYLMFRHVPAAGVFVDGRAITLYPAEFLQALEQAYRDTNAFDALAQRFAVDGVLMPAHSPRTQLLLKHLRRSSRWQRTYYDAVAEVYEPVATRFTNHSASRNPRTPEATGDPRLPTTSFAGF